MNNIIHISDMINFIYHHIYVNKYIYTGELVLISLIHGFYEECSGGTGLAITATQRKKAIENLAVMSGSDLVNQDRNYTRAYTNSDSDFKGKKQQQKEEEENNRIGVGMRLQGNYHIKIDI